MTKHKIEVGRRYMLIHGDGEGPDHNRAPCVASIDTSVAVSVIGKDNTLADGETLWSISYTSTYGSVLRGWACDRSFGDEVE